MLMDFKYVGPKLKHNKIKVHGLWTDGLSAWF
jgi:hypothetical protein